MKKQTTRMKRRLTTFCMLLLTLGMTYATTWTPDGTVALNKLVDAIADGDTIEIGASADSTYQLTTTFNVGDYTIYFCPADGVTGFAYLDGSGNNFSVKTGSIYIDRIEYANGKYFIQSTGATSMIKVTNCKVENIARAGGIYSGNTAVDSVIVENSLFYRTNLSSSGDSYPLFGSNQTSAVWHYFKASNSTFSSIGAPVMRIGSSTSDSLNIYFDHCTIDSIYGGSTPFYIGKNTDNQHSYNEFAITNCVITNLIGYSSIWSKCTFNTQDKMTVDATSIWGCGAATDSITSDAVTLNATTFVSSDPEYLDYSTDVDNRDFTIRNTTLLTFDTEGDRIGDSRWTSSKIWTPNGTIELNALSSKILDGDTIQIGASADSTYQLTTTFDIGSKSITIYPSDNVDGYAYIDGNGNNFSVKTGSLYIDGIEYANGKYFIQSTGATSMIKVTNCKVENIDRAGGIYSGNTAVDSVIVENSLFYRTNLSSSGDSYPLFGSNQTSAVWHYFKASNSTFSSIGAPVMRIGSSTSDSLNIYFDHCTIDSIYGGSTPFYIGKNTDNQHSYNEFAITNCVITNLIGYSSIWSKCTFNTQDKMTVDASSVWGCGAATDSASSDAVTLNTTTYVNSDPEYLHYTSDVTTRDYTIFNSTLLTLGTDGDRIGDPRWVTEKSTDATLSDLTVDGTTVTGFDPATTTYNVELAIGTTVIPVVSATLNDSYADTVVTQATALPGAATVVVTAEDGTINTYTISFTFAKSDDATLSDLTVDGTTIDGFDAGTTTYDVELAEGTTDVPEVAATATDENATVDIVDATALPGYTNVTVTAEDGDTKIVYTINFTVGTTAVDDASSLSLNIYPNPVASDLIIENENVISEAYIYSSNGQMVKSVLNINSNKTQINVSDLNDGLYLINVITIDNKVINSSFIKE